MFKYVCLYADPNGIIALNQISHHWITKNTDLNLFSNKFAKSKGQSLHMKFSQFQFKNERCGLLESETAQRENWPAKQKFDSLDASK